MIMAIMIELGPLRFVLEWRSKRLRKVECSDVN